MASSVCWTIFTAFLGCISKSQPSSNSALALQEIEEKTLPKSDSTIRGFIVKICEGEMSKSCQKRPRGFRNFAKIPAIKVNPALQKAWSSAGRSFVQILSHVFFGDESGMVCIVCSVVLKFDDDDDDDDDDEDDDDDDDDDEDDHDDDDDDDDDEDDDDDDDDDDDEDEDEDDEDDDNKCFRTNIVLQRVQRPRSHCSYIPAGADILGIARPAFFVECRCNSSGCGSNVLTVGTGHGTEIQLPSFLKSRTKSWCFQRFCSNFDEQKMIDPTIPTSAMFSPR